MSALDILDQNLGITNDTSNLTNDLNSKGTTQPKTGGTSALEILDRNLSLSQPTIDTTSSSTQSTKNGVSSSYSDQVKRKVMSFDAGFVEATGQMMRSFQWAGDRLLGDYVTQKDSEKRLAEDLATKKVTTDQIVALMRKNKAEGRSNDRLVKVLKDMNINPDDYQMTADTTNTIAYKAQDKAKEWADILRKSAGITDENRTFTEKVFEGGGSSAVYFIPAVGLSKFLGVATKVSPSLAMIFGGSASASMEAMAEAGQVYDEVKKKDGAQQAMIQSNKTFLANAILLMATERLGVFNPETKGILKKALLSAPIEAFQEATQQIIQNINTGKDPSEGVVEAGLIGGIIGGVMGAGADFTMNRPVQLNPMKPSINQKEGVGTQETALEMQKRIEAGANVQNAQSTATVNQTSPTEQITTTNNAPVTPLTVPSAPQVAIQKMDNFMAVENLAQEMRKQGKTFEEFQTALNSLVEEAKKYKTAEDFVRAQGETLYHGSISGDFTSFDKAKFSSGTGSDYFGKGAYLTDNAVSAKDYAYKDYSKVLSFSKGTAHIFDAEKPLSFSEITKILENLPENTTINKTDILDIAKIEKITLHAIKKGITKLQVEELVTALKSAGYDGVSFNARPNGIGGRYITIFNTDKIISRDQLTDIWNKAHAKTTTEKLVEEAKKYKEMFDKKTTVPPTEESSVKQTPDTKTPEGVAEIYWNEVIEPSIKKGETAVIGADDLKDYFGKDYNDKNHPIYSRGAYLLFERAMVEAPEGALYLTGGGAGSGKTEIIVGEVKGKVKNGAPAVLYDSNMSVQDGVEKQIALAVKTGRGVRIIGILPNLDTAWKFVQMRGDSTGRKVTATTFARGHSRFPATLKNLIEQEKIDPKHVSLLDERVFRDIEKIKHDVRHEIFVKDPLALLQEVQYNEEQVKQKYERTKTNTTENSSTNSVQNTAKDKGKISRAPKENRPSEEGITIRPVPPPKEKGVAVIDGEKVSVPTMLVKKTQVKDLLAGLKKDSIDFIVDADLNLVYKDGNRSIKLIPSALGLINKNLKKGQMVNINKEDLKKTGTVLRGFNSKGIAMASTGKYIEDAKKYTTPEEFVDAKIFDSKDKLPTEDIVGFKSTLNEKDLANVERLQEIEYKIKAYDANNRYAPYKISNEDKKFYDENISKYSELSKNYFENARQIKSQLTDIWNKAHAKTTTEKLVEEAKKYKTAEEFVDKKNYDEAFKIRTNLQKETGNRADKMVTLYHGTDNLSAEKIVSSGKIGQSNDDITFFTKSAKEAKEYATNKAKYRGGGRTPEVIRVEVPAQVVKNGQQSGVGGFEYEVQGILDYKDGVAKHSNENLVGVYGDAFKTRSQLTDIWNKAHAESNLLDSSKTKIYKENVIDKRTYLWQRDGSVDARNNVLDAYDSSLGRSILKNQIEKLDKNTDGTITVYRVGKPKGAITSVTTSKSVADGYAKHGYDLPINKEFNPPREITTINIPQDAIRAVIDTGNNEGELFVDWNKANAKVQQNGLASIGKYRDGTDLALSNPSSLKPIQFPELITLSKELMGNVPMIKAYTQANGMFYPKDGGYIGLNPDLFKEGNLGQLQKTLAHEIGHLIDYLPTGTMTRGNLAGRLNTLRDFRKDFLSDMGQSRTDAELREQMYSLSKYWRPYDEANASASFIAYRKSSPEIYADFISALFNDPKLTSEMAYTAYNVFFEKLDAKPKVKEAYFGIQDLLRNGDVIAKRRSATKEMFKVTEQQARERQIQNQVEQDAKEKSIWFHFKTQAVDITEAVREKVKDAQKKGYTINDDDNPNYYLEARNYLGGKIRAEVDEKFNTIYQELQKNDLTWEDLGELMFYERVLKGDRKEVANPLGYQPDFVRELYDVYEDVGSVTPDQKQYEKGTGDMKNTLGEGKFELLKTLAGQYRQNLKSFFKQGREEGIYNAELEKMLSENDFYVPFKGAKYSGTKTTFAVKHQKGTLGGIENPANTGIEKAVSIIRAMERNKVARKTMNFLMETHPDEVTKARTDLDGHPVAPKAEDGLGLVTYMEDGKVRGYYVDKYIADAIHKNTIAEMNIAIESLRFFNSKFYRPLFITFNLGFQSFNFVRDLKRFWKNIPNMTLGRTLKLYAQSARASKIRGFGLPKNPSKADLEAYQLIDKLEREQVLSITFNDIIKGEALEEKQIDRILREVGVREAPPTKFSKLGLDANTPVIKQIRGLMDFIENLGNTIETLPKVAGMYALEGTLPPNEMKSYVRKYVGSPDFLAGGKFKYGMNEVFLFSNAIFQGIRSDYEIATQPRTRSGWWMKTAQSELAPKLLMAMATAGLFGEYLKKLFENVSEYDKSNYIVVPIGLDQNGKTVYLRIPSDESGRMIGGIFWKALTAIQNPDKLTQLETYTNIMTYAGGQVPSLTPTITAGMDIAQFMAGNNPYDFFRGRPVLTDQQQQAGGMERVKPFATYIFQQVGGGVFVKLYTNELVPKNQSLSEKIVALPVLSNIGGRFLRVSDYGQTEMLRNLTNDIKTEKARESLQNKRIIYDYVDNARGKSYAEQSALKHKMVNEIFGGVPKTPSERTQARALEKRFDTLVLRGSADARLDALLTAQSNDEKIALLSLYKKTMSTTDFENLRKFIIQKKVVSSQAYQAFLLAEKRQ